MQLEWSEHSGEMVGAISKLLKAEELLDLTLSAGGKTLRVHRLILSAASEYFRVSTGRESQEINRYKFVPN